MALSSALGCRFSGVSLRSYFAPRFFERDSLRGSSVGCGNGNLSDSILATPRVAFRFGLEIASSDTPQRDGKRLLIIGLASLELLNPALSGL